jgi:hypothetical protein
MAPPIPRWPRADLASAALVAPVTAVIVLPAPHVPALGLGLLYVFAVVPIALVRGPAVARGVGAGSQRREGRRRDVGRDNWDGEQRY